MGSFSQFTAEDAGLPFPKPTPTTPDGQPRGNAQFVLPHVEQFSGIFQSGQKTYLPTYDEAMRNSRVNARVMRLDPIIDACMRLRAYPTALLPFHIKPNDGQNKPEATAAATAESLLASMPGFLYGKRWLLEAIFVGRSGLKIRWEKDYQRGRTWELPAEFEPVAGDKLVYTWDRQVGIRVNGSFSGDTVNDGWSRAYVLNPTEREQMIVHNFEPEDADYYLPQEAGAIFGRGLRDKLYWIWALKQKTWQQATDFLRWFANGLLVAYFESGNDEHRKAVESYVSGQLGNSVWLFPRTKDGAPNFRPIERFDVSTASPAFLQQLITEYFDEIIRQLIVGQTLTSGTAATGLGSGVAAAHQTTFDQIVKYDSVGLGETLTRDLLRPFYANNFPGIRCGSWQLDVDNPNVQQMMENAQVLYGMGGRISEEALLEAIGLPEVKPGDTILTQVQPMQPAAVGGLPEGVPVVNGQPVKMSRRQFARLCQLARQDEKVFDWAMKNRPRIEVSSLWVPAV